MEKNIFTYTRKEIVPPKADEVVGTPPQYKEYKDAFNISCIIRVVQMENGESLVLLNDIHQRLQEVPVYNKQGKQTAIKNQMNTFQSEIVLSPKDTEKLYDAISVYTNN